MIESKEEKCSAIDEKLGLSYSPHKSIIRVWAPSQKNITLCLYKNHNTQERSEYQMKKNDTGVFEYSLIGDYHGCFYTFLVNGSEVVDPYSFASNANSKRTAIINLATTDPNGFREHQNPHNDNKKAIICEAHVADISIDESSNIEKKGLFLGAIEENRTCNDEKTGIDHFEELGITHIHLLPVTDYLTVNELKPLKDYPSNFNWGYDQELYNNIEGSFSERPNDPTSRIREFKQLVHAFHRKNISVILDVVYNHTFRTYDSCFNVLEPEYYYRKEEDGIFSNGSGCGNEFASEKPMVRKFIIESLCYLCREYKIDGFRFDLMALIDIDTIELAIKELKKINPNILIYGEPWMACPSPLSYEKQIIIGAQKNKDFSIFNPFFRDAIKGDNDGYIKGYIQGEYYNKRAIEEGIAGSVGIDNKESSFANPLESINYFNSHDNLIFNDKLLKTNVDSEDIADITYIGFSLIMTSQGIPFFHAGNSFMRTKQMVHNSYNAPSSINGIDWSLKAKNKHLFNKIKNLIYMRKKLGIFNLETKKEVLEKLNFIDGLKDYIIAFTIFAENNYLIIHNVSKYEEDINLRAFTQKESIKLIWNGNFLETDVNNIKIGRYSTNIYII